MAIDLHKTAFDNGTKVKLFLYEEYLKEWLPVFLKRNPPIYKYINVFDFFAGPGCDIDGIKGSPLITVDALKDYAQDITINSLNVSLFFNDQTKWKIKQLKNTLKSLELTKQYFNIHISSLDFQEAFDKYYHLMGKTKTANFLFLDQSGVKHITKQIFNKIVALSTTDFLFFISSATFNRFNDLPGIKKYHHISTEKITSSNYQNIHRIVLEHYRSLIPAGMEYYLVPFSIKKGRNIYGLIFGSSSIRGLEKFLRRCWKIDPQRGEANFDIDDDHIDSNRPKLFPEMNMPKKLQFFEQDLSRKILNNTFKTNKDIFIFTLSSGFLPNHAREVINQLKNNNKLPKQKLNISYDSCIKRGEIQPITL